MNKVILIDCFDTIIYRKVAPEKIKFLWAKSLSSQYPTLSTNQFFKLIKSAENYFIGHCQEWSISQLCELMYNNITIYKLIEDIDKSFIETSINLYVQIELKNQFINKKIVKFLIKQKSLGNKIYIVSDFYCGKIYINKFLENLQINKLFDNIFVSCDLNMSKSKGDIYSYILNVLNLNPAEVMMIGDNKTADFINPSKLGIHCKKIYAKTQHFNFVETNNNFKISKSLKHTFNNNKGFSNYAFPLFEFIQKLTTKLLYNKTKDVFFLSREGEFLKKLFDYYCKYNNISIKSHYLQVSRNSIMLASLKDLENEKFDLLVAETGKINIFNFLKSLQFDFETISKIQNEINCDIYTNTNNIFNSKEFDILFKNSTFINYYNNVRTTQNKLFAKYLKQFNVDFNKGLTLVDVGWKGTMQDFLSNFFDNKIKIDGYYLGLLSAKNININNRKFGILYSCYPFMPTKLEKMYLCKIYNFEQILRASHNRVVEYKYENKVVKPVYDTEVDDKSFYLKYVKNIQSKIFDKFCTLCHQCDIMLNYHFSKLYLKMHLNTIYKDYKWLQNCLNNHFDSFARSGYAYHLKGIFKNYIKYKLQVLKFYIKTLFNKI